MTAPIISVSGFTAPPEAITITVANAMLERNIPEIRHHAQYADREATTFIVSALQKLMDDIRKSQQPAIPPTTPITPAEQEGATAAIEQPRRSTRKRRRLNTQHEPVTAGPRVEKALVEQFSEQSHPARGKRAPVNRKVGGLEGHGVSLAISDSCGPGEITRIRAAFQNDLQNLEVVHKHDGRDKVTKFSVEQAQELTNYFFDEVMGPYTLQRLQDLVLAYAPSDKNNDFDGGAAARLRKIAHDKSAPAVIRRFFGSFSHYHEVNKTHPSIQTLQHIIQSRELYDHYERVRNLIESGDVETVNFLRAQGLKASVGRGWSSVAIDFLADTVGFKRTAFVNTCERAKGINQLVDQFGEGILPLLPPNALSKLRRFGNQRMGPAYGLLKHHVASFQPICDLTRDTIYQPFVNGNISLRLDFASLAQPKRQTLIDIITDAVAPEQSTLIHLSRDLRALTEATPQPDLL